MKKIVLIFLLFGTVVNAQTNYSQMTNWHFHPNKPINILSNYNLDIALINKNLGVDSIISVSNNSTINTGVDVFFVHPTQLNSIPPSPDTIAISDQPNTLIAATIIAQGGQLAKYGRFFAPKYRQSSPSAFNNNTFSDSQRAAALLISYSDIKSSFLDYLNNHNNGNKIILAGHSQGSYLLGMLLRDLFDNDANLKSKLVTAALGGMAYVYSNPENPYNGWWENIALCSQKNECECVHNWTSFKENQNLPSPNLALPAFNQVLVDSGLVYQKIETTTNLFVQDSLFYGVNNTPLRYYITPDNTHNLSASTDFIAFDSLYLARYQRTSSLKSALTISFINDTLDLRPNELLSAEAHPNFSNWGFHPKDYHIYLWALIQQIDAKLDDCQTTATLDNNNDITANHISIFPNPSNGSITVKVDRPISDGEYFIITDVLGRLIKKVECKPITQIQLINSGFYFLISQDGTQKIIVN